MATYKKKLIEVSLPLPEVNDASAYDKMPGIGPHPKGIHHWWARLPMPTARAVLFASVVDDPGEHPELWPTHKAQDVERARLFDIVRRMMGKKLHDRPDAYADARAEMLRWTGADLPAVFDPFAGGGSIPLEANRLGFEAHAGDLNPVAALLNKCNLEIAPIWTGHAPVNPHDRARIGGTDTWRGSYGLAADVRYYGRVILDEIRTKLGHLYPTVRLPKSHGGIEASVIAWIWARTVASPDPAGRGVHVPLMSTFWLSSKGSEAWLKPVIDKGKGSWRFEVRTGSPDDRAIVKAGTKTGRAQFRCLLTGTAISDEYIKSEGIAGRMGVALVAIVGDAGRGRMYLAVSETHASAARVPVPEGELDEQLAIDPRNIWCVGYGLRRFSQLFTARQLTTLLGLSNCVREIANEVKRHAIAAGLDSTKASSYAKAVTTFLALALDRCADFNNSLCRWKPSGQQSMQLFGRQAIPMVWDFVEPNLMGEKAVCWHTAVDICAGAIEAIAPFSTERASARQIDAATGANGLRNLLVSTDPPYYDNISYASLSDFFYVWLRRSIGGLYPDLFSTVLVPKVSELTAAPERFDGDKQRARQHFESGFRRAFTALREEIDPRFPLTVYYAYKQSDDEGSNDDANEEDAPVVVDLTTGWETLLEALVASGFQITATWPVRASQAWRMRAISSNALASYIVLACRSRAADAPLSGRREFLAELRKDLPAALRHLQQGNVAPVDFAQAAIGPGMSIYSRYSRILEANGRPMSVRAALGLINQIKDEILGEPEADYDPSTRWAIAWYDQHGFGPGSFGDANTLATAHAIAVGMLHDAEVVEAREGEVRLLKAAELEEGWEPEGGERPSIWRMTHQLVRSYFVDKRGDMESAALLRKLGAAGDSAKDLAYRLHAIAERRKRSQDAQGYNALVLGWPEIARLAQSPAAPSGQAELI
jgi:putative DNA methylase